MVFVASILFASCFLGSALGLTLNTPADTAEDGTLAVTWKAAAGDPTFLLLLKGPFSVDIATGVNPVNQNQSVALGQVPPGKYVLQAAVGDAIEDVISTSGQFNILAKGTAAPPPAAAPPPPAAATSVAAPPPPPAATTAAAPPPPPAAAPPSTATNGGPPFDPAGAPHVGNGKGEQFIGGQCLSAADCASGCCAGPSGICSGPGAATQAGKTGCGFVSGSAPAAAPAAPAAAAPPAAAPPATASKGGPPFDPAGAPHVGNGQGQQFIGGQCLSQADCASGCCAGPSGICSGPGAATQAGKTGCGFVSKRFVNVRRAVM